MSEKYYGPHWNNSSEYRDIESPDFVEDVELLKKQMAKIAEQAKLFDAEVQRCQQLSQSDIELVEAASRLRAAADDAFVVGANLGTFVSCLLSVDGGHSKARQMQAVLRQLMTQLGESLTSLELILTQSGESFAQACLARQEFSPHRFAVSQERTWAPFLLGLDAEKLLTRFSVNGPQAWGTLYDNISSSLQCEVQRGGKIEKMGLARAAGGLFSGDREERTACYRAANSAWETQKESCASILNSLAGWRLDNYRTRSANKKLHFLDKPLHANRIKAETLNAMMNVVEESAEVGREALRIKAKEFKLDALAPWDLFAPAPSPDETLIPFAQAIELIRSAFADVDPQMGEFVDIMTKNGWIEGTVSDSKRPGAYCTRFAKSRAPRVYMTYRGSLEDVGTLAHELGHAFHNWVMRDLPIPETYYPMTLAETASIFAETVVGDVLLRNAVGSGEKRKILWGELGSAEAFLLNIPARFWFEKDFYEKRGERTLTPDEFSALMTQSWTRSYGNTLSEMNPLFWCSKLHFHISGTSFYNFPYTFGYLFALGVYAQREKQQGSFYNNYVNLLRDTGRMTAEELARKHLGVDLGAPEFWRESVKIVARKISEYQSL
ncbi:MAG: hypothetical protein RLZZ488_1100 [Pseudomonadota bacterium]|jgi:oligoendopeptidase F